MKYVEDNYPMDMKLTKNDIMNDLSSVVQRIGAGMNFQFPEEQVILKLINHSLGVKSQWKKEPKAPEIQYLLA